MSGITPPNPLSYRGQVVVPFIMETFPPQSTFNQFNVPTIWVDYVAKNAYMLTAKPLGVAEWVRIGGSPGEIDTITTPDGTTVVPTASNIIFANGSGMNITGSGSTVTFNSVGGGLSWSSVSGISQALVAGHAYVTSNGSLTTFSLPTTAAFGDFYIISGLGSGGWAVSQAAGQSLIVGNVTSTVGVGGSVSSTLRSDSMQIVCVTENTTFKVLDWTGNLTVV